MGHAQENGTCARNWCFGSRSLSLLKDTPKQRSPAHQRQPSVRTMELSDWGRFQTFRAQPRFVDMALVAADGQQFPAHQVVLAAKCPGVSEFFAQEGTNLEKCCVTLNVESVSSRALARVLDCVYGVPGAEELFDDECWVVARAFQLRVGAIIRVRPLLRLPARSPRAAQGTSRTRRARGGKERLGCASVVRASSVS